MTYIFDMRFTHKPLGGYIPTSHTLPVAVNHSQFNFRCHLWSLHFSAPRPIRVVDFSQYIGGRSVGLNGPYVARMVC